MYSNQIDKKKGLALEWGASSSIGVKVEEFLQMLPWQQKAFNHLKDAPYAILNAPMGSGKSWLMCLLSVFKMKQDLSLRVVIAIPQTIIAPGFATAKLQMPDGEKISWQVKHNLCKAVSSTGTVNHFIKWLKSPIVDDFSERSILCTHATLIAVLRFDVGLRKYLQVLKLHEIVRLCLLGFLGLEYKELARVNIDSEKKLKVLMCTVSAGQTFLKKQKMWLKHSYTSRSR